MRTECDLLVIGSGAAGLSAAVTAAHHGLDVVLAEKEPVLGGTTAWSGGWIFAPRTHLARAAGVVEDPDAPRRYLRAVLGPNFDPALVEAFLTHAPRMAAFFDRRTALQFQPGLHIPDTYGHQPGAGTGGRSLIAAPYDGRRLGRLIDLLRPPLRETSFLGMTVQAGPDLRAFLTATRSARSLLHVTRRLGRHLWDLARHRRGMQLRNGQALVARLLVSAQAAGVRIMAETPALRLLQAEGGVAGAVLATPAGEMAVHTRRGVVLATGGFPHDRDRVERLFPAAGHHRTLAVPSARGDGLRMGEEAGGVQALDLASPGAWCPVSRVAWPDGTDGTFPHIIDRGKPGLIAVLADGRRFCNEGLGYHDFVADLLAATPAGAAPEAWLICDHRFLRRFGLGIVRPAPVPIRPWLTSGYLRRGDTPEALAAACGIDPQGLAETLRRWNRDAAEGRDPDFGRGTTAYMRLQGDPDQRPNPCVAPILRAPFYAVKVGPGSFGTFAGLRTDAAARVLDRAGRPIAGLYAAGTDMASVMGGHYPAGGINLGPALTFGHIAALHAADALDKELP